jgi:phosphonopyruvate decarboxylase
VPTLPTRHAALRRVIEQAPLESSVVFASTGFCGRELYAIDDRANQLYMVGSMGCVTSFALGFALARPDLHVIVLDGDGAALMRMGAFATLGAYGPSNLTHVLFDNGVHDSTGGQATVSSQVSFARIAAACGYGFAIEGDTLDVLSHISSIESQRAGPRFIGLSIKGGTPGELPRPTVTPVDIKTRLMRHIEKI